MDTSRDIAVLKINLLCHFNNVLRTFVPFHYLIGWLGSRVVSVLDSGAKGPGFKSQPRRCRVTVLGKLFAPIEIGSSPLKSFRGNAGLAESNGSLPPGL